MGFGISFNASNSNTNVLVDNVTIQNRQSGINTLNATLSGVTIQNSFLSGNDSAFGGNGGNITNLTFLNNTFNNNSQALILYNITGLLANNNTLQDNRYSIQFTNVK
jgi:hypothetical protein